MIAVLLYLSHAKYTVVTFFNIFFLFLEESKINCDRYNFWYFSFLSCKFRWNVNVVLVLWYELFVFLLCLVCSMLPVSLDCHFWLPLWFSQLFIYHEIVLIYCWLCMFFFSQRIQLKYKELQQQQREESENFKEEINILTAEKESLDTVVSQITNQ